MEEIMNQKSALRNISITIVGFFLLFYIGLDANYYFWGDETQQVVPFTLHFYHALREHSVSMYNFTMGYGGSNGINFFTVLGSPSFWLFMLLPREEWIFPFFSILTIIRTILICYVSYLWLSKLVKSEKARYVGAFIMCFSGYIMYWQHFYYYADAWLYLCILLLSIELMLENKKKLLFPLIVCFTVVLYLYTAYMITWLVLFYFITRLYMLHPNMKFKELIHRLKEPICYYFLGIGMSAIVFIPDLYILLSSKRVNNIPQMVKEPSNYLITIKLAYRYFASLFSPVLNDYDTVIFSNGTLDQAQHYGSIYIYSSIIFVLLVPQLLKVKFKEKKALISLLKFLVICAIIPLVYLVFCGDLNLRWCFYFVITNVMIIAYLLENEDQFSKKLMVKSCILNIVFIIFFSYFAIKLNLIHKENYLILVEIVPALLIFLIIYTFSLVQNKNNILKIGLSLELLFNYGVRVLNGNKLAVENGIKRKTYESAILDRTIVEFIHENDDGFYRIATDEPEAQNYLVPMAKGFKGHSYYYGLYNAELDHYYENRITSDWFAPYLHSKFLSQAAFGQKYLINYDPNSYIPFGYKIIKTFDNNLFFDNPVKVLEHCVDSSLGYASNRTFADANGLDKSVEDLSMLQGIVDECSSIKYKIDPSFKLVACNVKDKMLDVSNMEPGVLFIDYSNILADSILSYELYRDGNIIDFKPVKEYGFTCINIDNTFDTVGLYLKNKNFITESIPYNIYYISNNDLDRIYQEFSGLDHFYDIESQGDVVYANITITSDKKLQWLRFLITKDGRYMSMGKKLRLGQ